MVCSPNGLKYVNPAWAGLGEAVDGRFRAGVAIAGDRFCLTGGRFGGAGSLVAEAVAIAATGAVVGAVGGSVGRRR